MKKEIQYSEPAILKPWHPVMNVFIFRNILIDYPLWNVTNALVLKGRNQVFLEMEEEAVEEDEPSAITLVNYFTNNVMQLRERSIYVQ